MPRWRSRGSECPCTSFAAALVLRTLGQRSLRSDDRSKVEKEEWPSGRTSPEEAFPDAEDPQLCPAYCPDIHQYLRSMEVRRLNRRALNNFIELMQSNSTANMRSILVDWLVEVAEEYKLLLDTLDLMVSYTDRYLSSNGLSWQELQLLGVSSMLITLKHEEIHPPHVEEFCYMT